MLDRVSLRDIPVVTMVLMVISILTWLAYELGMGLQVRYAFFISKYVMQPYLIEVMNGEVWRLVTPIFIHFSIIHILFNMLCMAVFASAVERKYGTVHYIILVLVIAILSNYAQYLYGGPGFGGMSGVVYGIFGYLWMQSKFNPWSGLAIHNQEIMFIMAWFVLCWTGLLGPIANMAHTVGLLMGIIWGYSQALYINSNKKR